VEKAEADLKFNNENKIKKRVSKQLKAGMKEHSLHQEVRML
jgi:hypothetical protein